ncbi:hypothetical protein L211DRAFT_854280 [Terfezia boudieri ATCC MYA-4762]|uniref:Uncharacterized protein n=1 Tax=Terfezia boudieri ATCC MYA-4762 TaxID=1051890 RepID=A0A3N4L9X6_9PEZI|nr:hypothetical protein L211DRAFT_854280 [Terfezia boudieri ATCC MYA-4762]
MKSRTGCKLAVAFRFPGLCNLNLLEYAPLEDRNQFQRWTNKPELSRKHCRGTYPHRQPGKYVLTAGRQPYHTIRHGSAAENLLCLNRGYHDDFGHGFFVLEPAGDPLAGLDPNGRLSEYEVRFSWVPQYQSRLPVPGDDESQHDLEDDHEAHRDDAGEGDDHEDYQLQGEGDWELAQVLDPGVPMEEERDPTLFGRIVYRTPAIRLGRRL